MLSTSHTFTLPRDASLPLHFSPKHHSLGSNIFAVYTVFTPRPPHAAAIATTLRPFFVFVIFQVKSEISRENAMIDTFVREQMGLEVGFWLG